MSRLRIRHAPSLLALSVLTTGCAGLTVQVERTQAVSVSSAQTVVVYPYRFKWTEPTWHAWQKSRDLTDALVADGRFAVYGPSEVKVQGPEDDNIARNSNVLSLLQAEGLAPEKTMVLRGWAVQETEASTRVAYDKKGKAVGRIRDERIFYIAHLQLVDVSKRRVLLHAKARVHHDPFDEDRPEWDPLYSLTRANTALLEWLLGRIEGGLPDDAGLGITWVANPGQAFTFKPTPASAGSAGALARLGPLEQASLRLTVYQYSDRDIPPSRTRLYDSTPKGTMVLAVDPEGAAAKSGLKAGDLVLTADRLPVRGPEVVLRRLRGRKATALTVFRDGKTLELTLQRR